MNGPKLRARDTKCLARYFGTDHPINRFMRVVVHGPRHGYVLRDERIPETLPHVRCDNKLR